MPTCSVRRFTEPEEYSGTIRQGVIELTVVGRGKFAASLTRIDFHRLWIQRFSETLPRIFHLWDWGRRAVIAFRTQPGPSALRSGLQLQPTSIVRHAAGRAYFQRTWGSIAYATMSLPIEEMGSLAAMGAGCDLSPPRDALLITPPPAAMARLQRLHAAAGRLAEEAPEVIADPDAARGLEQTLVEAMLRCLGQGVDRDNCAARGQHAIVMRRFRRMLEEKADQALYIPEVCKAIRVSERTLRVCCQEHLGMSPKRYLLTRRMHMVRRALRERAGRAATVTEIAMQYGFWQLGRFAVEYRALFGESPSATLRRRGS